jgi:nucleoside-diphosphate-sugar epimerase
MRVLVTGGTGNLGTAVLRRLAATPEVSELVGLCRRPPPRRPPYDRVRWHLADLAEVSSEPVLAAAMSTVDTVVHLAWRLQPARDKARGWRTNVVGSRRVFEAAAAGGAKHVVYASSVGAYSGRAERTPTPESWPTRGVSSSRYSQEKAAVEAWLDRYESALGLRVARIRPALVFQAAAASEVGRYFLGPLFSPRLFRLLRRTGPPVIPLPAGLTVQAVHADDLADAVAAILRARAKGPFNLGADVLNDRELVTLAGARRVPLPAWLTRAGLWAAYHARAVPTEPGWLDLAMCAPVLDAGRARRELQWQPAWSTAAALTDMLHGMATGVGAPSPALAPHSRSPDAG